MKVAPTRNKPVDYSYSGEMDSRRPVIKMLTSMDKAGADIDAQNSGLLDRDTWQLLEDDGLPESLDFAMSVTTGLWLRDLVFCGPSEEGSSYEKSNTNEDFLKQSSSRNQQTT